MSYDGPTCVTCRHFQPIRLHEHLVEGEDAPRVLTGECRFHAPRASDFGHWPKVSGALYADAVVVDEKDRSGIYVPAWCSNHSLNGVAMEVTPPAYPRDRPTTTWDERD